MDGRRPCLPPIEVVTNLSKSEDTFNAIETIIDNRADMSTDKWGITHERFKLVDFSYSLKAVNVITYQLSPNSLFISVLSALVLSTAQVEVLPLAKVEYKLQRL